MLSERVFRFVHTLWRILLPAFTPSSDHTSLCAFTQICVRMHIMLLLYHAAGWFVY